MHRTYANIDILLHHKRSVQNFRGSLGGSEYTLTRLQLT